MTLGLVVKGNLISCDFLDDISKTIELIKKVISSNYEGPPDQAPCILLEECSVSSSNTINCFYISIAEPKIDINNYGPVAKIEKHDLKEFLHKHKDWFEFALDTFNDSEYLNLLQLIKSIDSGIKVFRTCKIR